MDFGSSVLDQDPFFTWIQMVWVEDIIKERRKAEGTVSLANRDPCRVGTFRLEPSEVYLGGYLIKFPP